MQRRDELLQKLVARREALAAQIAMMKQHLAEPQQAPSFSTLQGGEKTHHSIAECEGGLRELDHLITELKASSEA